MCLRVHYDPRSTTKVKSFLLLGCYFVVGFFCFLGGFFGCFFVLVFLLCVTSKLRSEWLWTTQRVALDYTVPTPWVSLDPYVLYSRISSSGRA